MKLASYRFSRPFFPVVVFCLLLFESAQGADSKKGESLFKNQCASCHALEYKMTGPALKGITSTQSEDWFVKWILNNKKLRDSGDKSAIAIYTEYNQAQMNIFEGILTEGDVKDILSYIKDASVPKAGTTAAAGGAATGGASGSGSSGSTGDSGWISVGGLVLVILILFFVIAILNRVIKTLENLLTRSRSGASNSARIAGSVYAAEVGATPSASGDDFEAEQAATARPVVLKKDPLAGVKRLSKNRSFIVLIMLLTTVSFLVLSWDQLLSIGITKGYQPIQPINYSHQLHAGQLKIACQYCHGGAYKSKHAGIPAANICMNCHAAVQLREKYNGKVSPEIAKIYNALDYDPDTKKFGPDKKPIKWAQIHQLQDFVYFNHSQHTVVGGVQCGTCHGPIQTMKQVYQYSPLTMSWCINCHRQTPLNTQGNGYYDKMLAVHDKFKHGAKVTVAMMGGLECAKCHY